MDRKLLHENTTYALVKRLLKESVRPYLKWIAFALVGMVFVAGATAAMAWLMKPVINDVFVAKNKEFLLPISIAVLVTFAIKGFANYAQSVIMHYVGQRIIQDNDYPSDGPTRATNLPAGTDKETPLITGCLGI